MSKPRRTTISMIAAVAFALAALPATASALVVNTPTKMTFSTTVPSSQSTHLTETVAVQCTAMVAGMCTVNDTFTPNPAFSGANPGDFSQTNNCPPTLSNSGLTPGVCQFFISFKPTEQGQRTATLTLGTASGGGPTPISLDGFGLFPVGPPPPTGERAAALAKCKKRSKKVRKKCKRKANRLPR